MTKKLISITLFITSSTFLFADKNLKVQAVKNEKTDKAVVSENKANPAPEHLTENKSEVSPDKKRKWRFGLSLGGGVLSLDSQKLTAQGVEDSGEFLGVGMHLENKNLLFNVNLNFPFLDDTQAFSQTVQTISGFNAGQVSNESSEIDGMFIDFAVGYRKLFNEDKFQVAGLLGYTAVSIDRSIPYCTNCKEEHIDLDGGSFIRPSVSYFLGKKKEHELSLSYQKYFSSDIDSMFAFDYKIWF